MSRVNRLSSNLSRGAAALCLSLVMGLAGSHVTRAEEPLPAPPHTGSRASLTDAPTVPPAPAPSPTDSSPRSPSDDHHDQADAAAPHPADVLHNAPDTDLGAPVQQEPDITLLTAPPGYWDMAVRSGWWQIMRQGSATKVGEYQGLGASLFWDLDFLTSDRQSTLDLFGTGLDNETTHSGFYLFTPAYEANFRYERFLHRLDHDPLTNMPRPDSGAEIMAEDLDVGADYAVRIQNIRTDVSGKLSENVKYRVDVWLRRKAGERQALGTHHGLPRGGYACSACHVVSQPQQIDWLTTRVEPIIEARFGSVTAEYSRPMRFFGQNDATVTRSYGSLHPYDDYAEDYPYAVVPESVWQTDRLKLRTELPLDTSFYALLFHGTTKNLQRDTHRGSYGFDLRASNTRLSRTTLSAFVRYNRQLNQFPPFLVTPEEIKAAGPTAVVPPYGLRHPVDYLRVSTGADAIWRPFRTGGLADQLALDVGTELGTIGRSYADYQIENPPGFVSQGSTSFTSYSVGASMRWHPRFDNRLRYRHRNTSHPLFGINGYDNVTNSNLPTSEDMVGLDTTWQAADNFLTTASVSLENRHHHSSIADFTENSYPMTFTFWYAPCPEWSISGGYGFLSNWIDQAMYFPGDLPEVERLDSQLVNFGGRGQFWSLGLSRAWTEQLTVSASLQEVWASDAADPLALWPDLMSYSAVRVNTRRYTCGLDWAPQTRLAAYLRYVFDEYDDESAPYYSGRAHMVLAGLTGVW